jgi:glutathione S-transferase
MGTPHLYGTPLSHFARKIRILLAELEVPYEFLRAQTVLATSTAAYGDNPLMRVPTLVHDGVTVIESDHIARYLVNVFDPKDRLGVRSEDVTDMNRLAVVSGIMDSEVVLLLAKRSGLADPERIGYFRKLQMAIEGGLAWLDKDTDPDAGDFRYGDIALVCMWQHVLHYEVAKDVYPRIAARVARFEGRPSVASTTPKASLEEALAAGWTPPA